MTGATTKPDAVEKHAPGFDEPWFDIEDCCPVCGGDGFLEDECECGAFEDVCCCLVPTPRICPECDGKG